MPEVKTVISCEHASNYIPKEFIAFFDKKIISTHRAYDIGAAEYAAVLGKELNIRPYLGKVSRLVIDLNRSLSNRKSIFISRHLRGAEDKVRKMIIEKYYTPYRHAVESEVRKHIKQGNKVIHIAVHSFTPVMKGTVRNAEIGILFDPARKSESQYAREWKLRLKKADPKLKVRLNYPYRGADDGLTTYMRKKFPDSRYAGFELEINQAFPLRGGRSWTQLKQHLTSSIAFLQ